MMKTIEQKAKAYDEAIERARHMWFGSTDTSLSSTKETVEYIFPEFAESEDDKVRKELCDFCIKCSRGETIVNKREEFQRWAAWLEKQGKNNMGISEATKKVLEDNLSKALEKETPESLNEFLDEHKPADKVEPKFKVGDIIRHKKQGFTCKIIAIDTEYRLSECNGSHLPFEFQDSYELIEQNPSWSEEDETALYDALWAMKQAAKIAKDENDMGNIWYAENWLKSLKQKMKGE